MARCLISFGANIGDAGATIQAAAARLQERLCGGQQHSVEPEFQLSRRFRTPPVGGPAGQAPFINAVAAVTTAATPWEVWHCIRLIEREFGRERNLRWEARRIDLDILLYDDQRIWTPHLKIPHPRMCMRRFILLPAVDVARDWLDPVSGWTIGQLADNVRNGPGNFVLLAQAESHPESLLAEVARCTGAQWQATIPGCVNSGSNPTPGRWVSTRVLPLAQLTTPVLSKAMSVFPQPNLVIVLAPQVASVDVAWEDYHQALAIALGLQVGRAKPTASPLESTDPNSPAAFLGPRYLLAGDDRGWAVQELIAAIEAMDCPIEVS